MTRTNPARVHLPGPAPQPTDTTTGDTAPMLTAYLAARYSRRDELRGYRADLEHLGYTVSSRWLNGAHQISDQGLADTAVEGTVAERVRFAQEDWEDLNAADVVVSFTEPPRTGPSRGGRHVEFGAALALGKAVHIVGHRENVFHCMPAVHFHEDWTAARGALGLMIATAASESLAQERAMPT